MYTRHSLRVKWGNTVSSEFTVSNGVKQGGVLSPILFAIYTDGLLKRLEETGVGCDMGSRFTGALAYAVAYAVGSMQIGIINSSQCL